MEGLHRLSNAELYNKKGPLPFPIHRPNPRPTGRIKLLPLPQRILGLQPDCDSSRRSREDDVHMSFWHIRLQMHAIRTVQRPGTFQQCMTAIDNMQNSARKHAYSCDKFVKRGNINYVCYMLSYEFAKMNIL